MKINGSNKLEFFMILTVFLAIAFFIASVPMFLEFILGSEFIKLYNLNELLDLSDSFTTFIIFSLIGIRFCVILDGIKSIKNRGRF